MIKSLDSYDSNWTQIGSDLNELDNQLPFQYECDLKIKDQEATSPIKGLNYKINETKYEYNLNLKDSD